MANEAAAFVPAPAAAPSEDEYETLCSALSASARGRAFLDEYARRHRGADTETLLAALARLESLIRAQRTEGEPDRTKLRALVDDIRHARPDIESSALSTRAVKLAQLLDLLEQRLAAMADIETAPVDDTGGARLAVVPPLEEPELPIPSLAITLPMLTVADDRGPPTILPSRPAPLNVSRAGMPEVSWIDAPPRPAQAPAPPPKATAPLGATASSLPTAKRELDLPQDAALPPINRESIEAPQSASEPQAWAQLEPMPPPPDPLGPLMLLSEEERLALFT